MSWGWFLVGVGAFVGLCALWGMIQGRRRP